MIEHMVTTEDRDQPAAEPPAGLLAVIAELGPPVLREHRATPMDGAAVCVRCARLWPCAAAELAERALELLP